MAQAATDTGLAQEWPREPDASAKEGQVGRPGIMAERGRDVERAITEVRRVRPGVIERAAQEAIVRRVGGVTTMTKSQKDYDLKAGVRLLEKMGYGDLQITKDLRAVSEGKPPAGLPVKLLKLRPRVKGAGGGLRYWKKRGKK